jgi:transcription elongation factor GreA
MENAAYDEAKDQQAFVEGRIIHLEDLLKRASVIADDPATGVVRLGSLVTVAEGSGAQESFRIVGTAEADPSDGCISNESPMGRSLMGKRVGETATYDTPDGDTLVFRIAAIQ